MSSPGREARRTSNRIPGRDSPLPPVQDRLAYLRPSRELLQFYREKIAQYDGEHEELLQILEKYRGITDDQNKLQWEVRQREAEIAELQNALSDMQVYLFQEREQSLRLYAENDRLKIRELEDRKKIQHLLTLVGPDAGEITFFHQEPPHKVAISQRVVVSSTSESDLQENLNLRPTKPRPVLKSKRGKSEEGEQEDSLEQCKNQNRTLLLQVQALQAQMEEQTRLAKEQIESLQEDRNIKTEEAQAQQQRDQDRIRDLNDKLHRNQNLLHQSTKDFLHLKFEIRAQENAWMVEKDTLLKDLDTCRQRLNKRQATTVVGWQASTKAPPPPRPPPDQLTQTRREEIKAMQEDLKQTHRLAEMYRDQCVNMEAELAKTREAGDVGREIFKERSDKMSKRLQLMTQRCEALEKRRVMEAQGFKADLRNLRQKLKDVEKQLQKVRINVGQDQDLPILQEIRQSNFRTKKIQGELLALKAKIYGLENELRNE